MNVDRKFQYHCVITMLYRIHMGSKIKENNQLDFYGLEISKSFELVFDMIPNSIRNEHE